MHLSTASALLAFSSLLLPIVSAAGVPQSYAPARYGRSEKTSRTGTTGSTGDQHHHHHHHKRANKNACTFARKRNGVAAELTTIVSHSMDDADLIPLAADATRTFFVTPNEAPEMTVELTVGSTASSVREELVLLATVLNAGVPADSIKYIRNRNGTVTSDFIQTDNIVLPSVNVREIHTFNDNCEISSIVGYVQGDIMCPVGGVGLVNSLLITLCSELEAAGLVGTLQKDDKSE